MKKNPLIIIFLVVFIDLVGFGIVIPILPYYAESYGASATMLGWLLMSYSAMQFLFAPFWGRLSDKIGRRPVLLFCILGLAGSLTILGFAPSLIWLFAGRILAGLFGANISAATAYIADVTSPEKRAKGMGLIGAAFGLGFLIGPAVGGLLSRWGYGVPPLFAAGLALLNFFFALSFLKEPNISEEVRCRHREHVSWEKWKKIVAQSKTGLAILLFFLVTLGIAQLETAFAFFLLARFQLQAFHAGLILALMGLVLVVVQGGLIGKLVKSFGEKNLVLIGSAIMALSLIGASYSFTLGFLIPFFLIHAVGYGITNPSLTSLTSRSADSRMQGATLGVYHSAGSLARILGPIAAGVLFDYLGIHVPFLAASGFFGIACLLIILKGRVWVLEKEKN